MKKYIADSITEQVVRVFKQFNAQLIAIQFKGTNLELNTDHIDFKGLTEKTDEVFMFLKSHPDIDIINQFKKVDTINVFKATIEGCFKPYSQSVIDILENINKIKNINHVATGTNGNDELPGKEHVVENVTETKGSFQTPKLTTANIETLKSYFKSEFLGIRNGSTNKFEELFLKDLKKPRTGKDFVTIAFIVYDSGVLIGNKKPNTFEKWKNIFLDLICIKRNTYHRSHVLERAEELKYEFTYFPEIKNIKFNS